ncbi:hypothetical protein DL764_002359 [Monosporascus ibericus]|uniref:Uncharacterized protein n=1 Tax=Monosporascus ibericus TaxID=155417 RepID=A0A4Q4TP44_9PEZI|nr:hypothetical protein DL764_002359 [Monosporascus ibericus]
MGDLIKQEAATTEPVGTVGKNGVIFAVEPILSQPTQAWETLSKCLPSRDADKDYWWNLTGRHMAAMVCAAGYSAEKQLEALLYYYHWTVPYLGPSPVTNRGKSRWNSLLTVDGTPIEYSWKWNTATTKPDIRFTMEPMNRFTGTSLDPLNQLPSRELLYQLEKVLDTVDLTWVNYFFSAFFDHDTAKYVKEKAAGAHLVSSVSLAFEFVPKGLSLKTYFAPRKLGQVGLWPLAQWEAAIRGLEPNNLGLDTLDQFLASTSEGKLLSPFMLAVDNVAPAASRMKFYFQTPRTSFHSVREIMTMGGLITGLDRQLADLRELILAVTGLPADFPEDAEMPAADEKTYSPAAKDNFVDRPDLLSGYMYYFDIAPGARIPEIKFYTPTRHYGRDDRTLADGIVSWMEAKGRGAYGQAYLEMLESLAEHRKLSEGQGLQTYVSCLFKKNGELDITTYLAPEAYHAARHGNGQVANGYTTPGGP